VRRRQRRARRFLNLRGPCHMATHHAAARDSVLATPELLNLILSTLHEGSLFRTDSVSRRWRAATRSQVARRSARGALTLGFTQRCAAEGALQLLQTAHESGAPWGWRMCYTSAKGGHLELLRWLRTQNPPCPWDAGVCAAAAENGHVAVLEWLRAQDPPCPWDSHACAFAARGGCLEVLQWLRAQDKHQRCPALSVERMGLHLSRRGRSPGGAGVAAGPGPARSVGPVGLRLRRDGRPPGDAAVVAKGALDKHQRCPALPLGRADLHLGRR
jgi:hypothetical protein